MDLETLLEGTDISQEFKDKAKVLFESAVNTKVSQLVEEKEKEFATLIEEKDAEYKQYVEKQLEETVDKLDEYLDYVVSEWYEENKIAIESGTKLELAESLFSGLKVLFVEHNIDVPDEKVDVVSGLEESLKEANDKLNEQIELNASMHKSIKEFKRAAIISEACKGMIDTKAEKLKQLSETVSFDDEDSFRKKLEVLKSTTLNEAKETPVVEKLPETAPVSGHKPEDNMSAYIKAISRVQKF